MELNSKTDRMGRCWRRWTASALLASTAGLAATAMVAPVAAAQERTAERAYDIPAGPLAPALSRFAVESGLALAYGPEVTRGLRTQGLRGAYAPEAGLAALLEGSGVSYRATGAGGFTLVRAAAAAEARAARAAVRDTPLVRARAEAPEETIVVVGRTTNAAVTFDELELQQANDLSDVFRLIPSVSVGGSLGIAQKVYIRGLEDTLLNITVDGAPQTGTLFHHIGRVSVEPELLQRVEVQAGAGEATSGFGAIGGAIRFRTRSASDLLQGDQNFGGLARAGYFSNEGYRASLTGFGRVTDDWSLLGSYVYVDREHMQDGAGDEIAGSAGEQALAFVKLSGDLTDNQRLTLSFERREEEGEFGQRPNWPVLAGDSLFPVEAERNTLVANYQLDLGDAVNIEATAYWTRSEFEQDVDDRWGRYGAELTSYGFDLRNTAELGAHRIVYGVEYRNDEVMSRYLEDVSVWGPWAWDPSVGRFEETGEVWGLYAQDHFQVSDPLLISFGLRYDSYDLEQVTYENGTESEGVSANIGAAYDITPDLQLSVGYAEAMRGKEVGDAFTLEHRPGRIALAPGLKAEDVSNAEIGLVFDNGAFRASASYFDMEIENVILDQIGNGPAPQASVYYDNVGTYESDGFELRIGYSFAQLSADLFFNSYDAELNGHTVEGYEEIGLGNASGDRWSLNIGYEPLDTLTLGWNVTHVEDLNDIEVLYRAVEIGWIGDLQQVDKPGYTVHDLYAQWRPRGDDTLTVNFAVQNLFDEHYRDHASVADYNHIPGWEGVAGLYEAGRDVRVSLGLRF